MSAATGDWAERCAADAEARDWAMEYGRGDFYWSEKWGALTAIADGTTTVTDVADALAAGTATPYQEALAASFWVNAADYLAVGAHGAATDARNGHPEPGLADDNGQVPWLTDPDEVAATAARQAAADAALAETQKIHRAAVDAEDDHRRWLEAKDEDEYHAAGAAAARAADVDEAWRKAVAVEYDQICADYGNDGRPEDDRHISAEDKAAQAAAVAAIAERAGLPTGAVWDAVRDVTDRYARDHTDTATLGQPDWDQVADSWANMLAEQQKYRDDGARAAAAAALEAAAQDREITGTYRDMGWTAEQIAQADDGMTVAQAQDALDRLAAYEAAVSPPAAEPGTDAHTSAPSPTWTEDDAYIDKMHADHLADALEDPMGRVDAGLVADPDDEADQAEVAVAAYRDAVEASRADWYARAAQLGVTTASPTPPAELDTWAARNPDAGWAGNEDVVARFESDAALDAEAGDGAAALDAHQPRLAEAAAEQHTGRANPEVWGAVADAALAAANRAQWYPQGYSAADDSYDHALHHGEGADLPPVPAEYTEHPDAHRSGPTAAAAEELAVDLHALDTAPGSDLYPGDVDATADPAPPDPELAAKTAAWMADEAAATERWLADNAPGFTAVDSNDRMVERHRTDQQYAVSPVANPWYTAATPDERDSALTDEGEPPGHAPVADVGVQDAASADRVSALFGRAAAALAAELAGGEPEPRGKPDGEPSTEELVAAAREACAELGDDQDEIADPVADVPVVDESAVADDAAVVAAQDTVGGAA